MLPGGEGKARWGGAGGRSSGQRAGGRALGRLAAAATLTGRQDGGILTPLARREDDIEALAVDRLQVEEGEDHLKSMLYFM